MRSLRARLFAATLAALALTLALTIAIGAVLTRRQVDRSQASNVARRADDIAQQRRQHVNYVRDDRVSGSVHILTQHIHDNRRIFTDGRDWPANLPATFIGYSIGRWVDTNFDGHFDLLEVETRGLKGQRSYDTSGLPLHLDGQTIVKERIYVDKADPEVAHDEVTVIDHALTRPWTVMKNYRRVADPRPYWREISCFENNDHVEIGKEPYMLSADRYLMPTKKDQPPPDLRYFKQTQK